MRLLWAFHQFDEHPAHVARMDEDDRRSVRSDPWFSQHRRALRLEIGDGGVPDLETEAEPDAEPVPEPLPPLASSSQMPNMLRAWPFLLGGNELKRVPDVAAGLVDAMEPTCGTWRSEPVGELVLELLTAACSMTTSPKPGLNMPRRPNLGTSSATERGVEPSGEGVAALTTNEERTGLEATTADGRAEK